MAAGRERRLMQAITLTREWVIEQLIDNVSKAKGSDTPNLNAANKALHLLGLECGMFATVIKATHLHADLNQLTDRELIEIATEGRSTIIEAPSGPKQLN
jgi:hypothetical protein